MDNPYQTPDADVASLEQDTYQPSPFTVGGRLGRVRYLTYSLASQMLLSVPELVLALISGRGLDTLLSSEAVTSVLEDTVTIGTSIILLLYSIALGRRRLHDMGKTALMLLLYLIPVVNVIFGLYLLLAAGEKGRNRFGPAPAPNSRAEIAAAWITSGLFVGLIVITIGALQT